MRRSAAIQSNLFSIFEGCAPRLLACFCGTAVREEDVIGWVKGYGCGEELDGLVVIFGSKGFVALVFEIICLNDTPLSHDGECEGVRESEPTSDMFEIAECC
jgi:hypothetical protein